MAFVGVVAMLDVKEGKFEKVVYIKDFVVCGIFGYPNLLVGEFAEN